MEIDAHNSRVTGEMLRGAIATMHFGVPCREMQCVMHVAQESALLDTGFVITEDLADLAEVPADIRVIVDVMHPKDQITFTYGGHVKLKIINLTVPPGFE